MRIAAVAGAALVLVASCSAEDELAMTAGGRPIVELLDTDGIRVAAYERSGTCFAYSTASSAGSRCMFALGAGGWAVETAVVGSGPGAVLLVGADVTAVEVRVPLAAGGHLSLRPRTVAGVPQRVEAVMVDPASLALGGNGVTAYDEAGTLLGRTHDCAGLGGTDDCGPYDGVFDKRIQPAPSPSPS